MILQFKHLQLHNFGSYADAQVNLDQHGFCLVSGANYYKKDNAISNGSGKSTIWSAICFALTGETVTGLKTNLKNINIDSNSCFVKLDCLINSDTFSITRIIEPKSDLKIIKNDVDISGKGIRESEKILATIVPDLTKELIASTIILGQGLPNKFSSFSPSGRKDLLEQLTRSDFMIEDIKARLLNRQAAVQTQIRELTDSILVNNTTLNLHKSNLTIAQQQYNELIKTNSQELLLAAKASYEQVSTDLAENKNQLTKLEADLESQSETRIKLLNEKVEAIANLNNSYNNAIAENTNKKIALESDIKALRTEIAQLKAIVDTCPTCGQKLIGVEKPNTQAQEQLLYEKQQQLEILTGLITDQQTKYNAYKQDIDSTFDSQIQALTATITAFKDNINKLRVKNNALSQQLTIEQEKVTKLAIECENREKYLSTLTAQISNLEINIKQLTELITLTEASKNEVDEHLAVLKKMDTLVKRDFRGYLLTDIINYIDLKAKEYCQIVFGTSELSVYLDGNALDITYCSKLFDSLSGGEKQRCDLILQFAIRDLLQTYLNYSSNILVLDEVFDGLDKKATTKIIDLIATKLKDVESVFIISHHADDLELPVDSELNIIKTESGISEVH